jgi:coenzyme F420-reducing hydrogenase alpha subunit
MNVQNLSKAEREQLQALLNKMNSSSNKLEEMIVNIIENFDFGKVQVAMENMNWRWRGEHVSIEMIKSEAERLLREAAKHRLGDFIDQYWELGIITGTGGLEATAFCDEDKTRITALDLKFVLAEWDSSEEEL